MFQVIMEISKLYVIDGVTFKLVVDKRIGENKNLWDNQLGNFDIKYPNMLKQSCLERIWKSYWF